MRRSRRSFRSFHRADIFPLKKWVRRSKRNPAVRSRKKVSHAGAICSLIKRNWPAMPLLPQKTEPAEAERRPFFYQQSSNHPFSLFYEHIITNGDRGCKKGAAGRFLTGPAVMGMAAALSGQPGKRSGGRWKQEVCTGPSIRGDGKASERGNFYFPSLRLGIPRPDYVHRETERAEPARAAGFLRFSWRFHLERKDTHEKSGTRIQNQQ